MKIWKEEEDQKAIQYIIDNGFKRKKDMEKAFNQLSLILNRTPSSIEKRYYRVLSKKIEEIKSSKKSFSFGQKIKNFINEFFIFFKNAQKKKAKNDYLYRIEHEINMMIEKQNKKGDN